MSLCGGVLVRHSSSVPPGFSCVRSSCRTLCWFVWWSFFSLALVGLAFCFRRWQILGDHPHHLNQNLRCRVDRWDLGLLRWARCHNFKKGRPYLNVSYINNMNSKKSSSESVYISNVKACGFNFTQFFRLQTSISLPRSLPALLLVFYVQLKSLLITVFLQFRFENINFYFLRNFYVPADFSLPGTQHRNQPVFMVDVHHGEWVLWIFYFVESMPSK